MNDYTRLLYGYCHLVNKTVQFLNKYFEGIIPAGRLDEAIYWRTKAVYEQVEESLEQGHRAQAQELVEEYLEFADRYFEEGNPWETRKIDRRACRNTILNTVQMVANLTVLVELFADYPARKVDGWLCLRQGREVQRVPSGYELPRTETLAFLEEDRVAL